ncbi:hypothetical protein LTR95_008679 [Oleoguttula sp. CCFEE 5521]
MLASPWSWRSSSFWDGNDGLWNSFIVQVGTPPQDFRVFPSTAGQETWVLNPQGCVNGEDPTGCPCDRGAIPPGVGFDVNASSTWLPNGIFTLNAQEEQLGYTGNGLYGFDAVVLGTDQKAINLSHQVLASIADKSYYLGQFGLGPKPINFTTFNEPIPNYLSTLVNFSMIPSLSFGYTAGAAYRNKSPASLTLGGYDSNRFNPTNLSIAMNVDNSRPLQIALQKVQARGNTGGDVDLLPEGTFHFVDSTIPHIWLPQDAVNAFVSTFGLSYDSNTDLFLINDTMRQRNLQSMPTLYFSFGASLSGGATQTISLPYSAFDLQAGYPFYENATNYFPIRVAHNDTQYTIGRTFFQEAYVIADWERQNFTIAQTSFDNLNNVHLVAITPPMRGTAATTIAPDTNIKNLSKGVIVGIAIGAVLLAGAAIMAVALCIRRRRKQQARIIAEDGASRGTTHGTPALHEQEVKPMLPYAKPEMSSDHAVNELPASADPVEVDAKSQAILSQYHELPAGSDEFPEHIVNPNARERQARVHRLRWSPSSFGRRT